MAVAEASSSDSSTEGLRGQGRPRPGRASCQLDGAACGACGCMPCQRGQARVQGGCLQRQPAGARRQLGDAAEVPARAPGDGGVDQGQQREHAGRLQASSRQQRQHLVARGVSEVRALHRRARGSSELVVAAHQHACEAERQEGPGPQHAAHLVAAGVEVLGQCVLQRGGRGGSTTPAGDLSAAGRLRSTILACSPPGASVEKPACQTGVAGPRPSARAGAGRASCDGVQRAAPDDGLV